MSPGTLYIHESLAIDTLSGSLPQLRYFKSAVQIIFAVSYYFLIANLAISHPVLLSLALALVGTGSFFVRVDGNYYSVVILERSPNCVDNVLNFTSADSVPIQHIPFFLIDSPREMTRLRQMNLRDPNCPDSGQPGVTLYLGSCTAHTLHEVA